MDIYIFATMMHERIINCIVSRNNDGIIIKYIGVDGFKLHFYADNNLGFLKNEQELKKRMKEDGVASLLIYHISEE